MFFMIVEITLKQTRQYDRESEFGYTYACN